MTSTIRLSGLIAVCAWILSILIAYSCCWGFDAAELEIQQVEFPMTAKPGAVAVWSPWGEWGECEGICGSRGKMFRRRKCIKSSPDQDCPSGKVEGWKKVGQWRPCPTLHKCSKEE